MFENITKFFRNWKKKESKSDSNSRDTAKERLHLVLMQDRANVSADFLELMKQEIIEVIKKYIDVDESAIDVRLTNKENSDGTNGAPALYANIPILNIKNEARKINVKQDNNKEKIEQESIDKKDESKQKKTEEKKEEEAEQKVEQAEIIIEEANAEKEVKEENEQEDKSEESELVEEQEEAKEEIKSENN